MPRPALIPPIGLRLAGTARAVTQAFERAMVDAGGSGATWQVLLLVRSRRWGTQSELAEAMGVTAATLTHHLNALEDQGLVRRWRDSSNRRVQNVELTERGGELFDRLRKVAGRHDARLRSELSDEEVEQLAGLLDRLEAAVREPAPSRRGGDRSPATLSQSGRSGERVSSARARTARSRSDP